MKILVVDNFDSFVFNLVDYLRNLGAECDVVKNDAIDDVESLTRYDGVLISPGPGNPEGAGKSIDIARECARTNKPLLGVCLGQQVLAVAFGGVVSQATELLHGKTSMMSHDKSGILKDINSPLKVGRYHSLAITTLPDVFDVVGKTESGVIMAIRHRTQPLFGLQFHPESVLTEQGYTILGNWLVECGDRNARQRSEGLSPLIVRN